MPGHEAASESAAPALEEPQLGAAAERKAKPEASVAPSRWTGGRIAGLGIGVVLVLVSLALFGGGATGLWADLTQREAGYVTTGVHEFSTSGSALVTEPAHLGSPGVGWLYSPGLLGTVRIRATPANARSVFVGIGRSRDVDGYLAGVSRSVISDFFGSKVEAVGGGSARSAPGAQHFWVASSVGHGARTLTWDPHGGSWAVVVMNADGRAGLDVRADLGARMPAVRWIAIGFVVAGVILLTGGGMLIAGAVRNRREGRSR